MIEQSAAAQGQLAGLRWLAVAANTRSEGQGRAHCEGGARPGHPHTRLLIAVGWVCAAGVSRR